MPDHAGLYATTHVNANGLEDNQLQNTLTLADIQAKTQET
jgi:hypothetical protein